MNEYIDSMGDTQILPALDTNTRYWKVETDELYYVETVFTSHHGLY